MLTLATSLPTKGVESLEKILANPPFPFCEAVDIPSCRHLLPRDAGGITEMKFCLALDFLKMTDCIFDFEHALPNSPLDQSAIDFNIWFVCGCQSMRQIKRSDQKKRMHLKRAAQHKINPDIVVDVIWPEFSIGRTLDYVFAIAQQHASFCRKPFFMRPV